MNMLYAINIKNDDHHRLYKKICLKLQAKNNLLKLKFNLLNLKKQFSVISYLKAITKLQKFMHNQMALRLLCQ